MPTRKAQWKTDTQFDFGSPTKSNTETVGTGDSAYIALSKKADNDDNINYNDAVDYTPSDPTKITVDESGNNKATLKTLSGTSNVWPFTTPANYTYDPAKIQVDGVAKIINNKTYVEFGGTDEYASVGDKANLDFGTNNFSVSFWIKTNSNANAQIIGKQDAGSGWYIYVNNATSALFFYHRKDGKYTTSTTVISDNVWHHVVFYRDGVNGRFYIDNVNVTSINDNISADFDSAGDACEIGRRNLSGSPDRYFVGSLDNIAFWDKKLSVLEINNLYNLGQSGNLASHSAYANVISWWKMGEGDTFPTLIDTKDSNPATMVNMESSDIITDITDSKIETDVGFVFTSALSSFVETATKPAGTELKYQVSIDDGVTYLWWNGSAWVTRTGGQTDQWYYDNESNLSSVINSNIASIGSSGTFKEISFLHVPYAGVTPELDSITVTEATTYSTNDNLYIDTKNTSQIEPSVIFNWLTTIITNTLPANTDIKLLFSNDGRTSWLTWSGSAWVAPASAVLRANATSITDAQANFSDIPLVDGTLDVRVFLYTSDLNETPEVDNINIISDTGYETSGSYESTTYQPEDNTNGVYLDSIAFDITTPSGTTLTVEVRHVNHTLETGYVEYENGDDINYCGNIIQFKVTLTSTGENTSRLNWLEVDFHTLIGIMRSIDTNLFDPITDEVDIGKVKGVVVSGVNDFKGDGMSSAELHIALDDYANKDDWKGSGINSSELHVALDDYTNKDDWKSSFDPNVDEVDIGKVKGVAVTDIDDFKADLSNITVSGINDIQEDIEEIKDIIITPKVSFDD